MKIDILLYVFALAIHLVKGKATSGRALLEKKDLYRDDFDLKLHLIRGKQDVRNRELEVKLQCTVESLALYESLGYETAFEAWLEENILLTASHALTAQTRRKNAQSTRSLLLLTMHW